ncbi:G1/S-specific cyclin-E isoform X3 [Ceratitis capitata]|nr:G1/S-specific cyclin-E isoform X3 [Ceratitis capitata]XP_020712860.1 G1/S-specific cyclin-E isoform X3 [Ceratitis capitata]
MENDHSYRKLSSKSPNNSEQNSSKKINSGRKNYKMNNASKYRQSRFFNDVLNRRKAMASDSNNGNPDRNYNTLNHVSSSGLSQSTTLDSPQCSTYISEKTIEVKDTMVTSSSAAIEPETSPSSSSIDSVLLRGWSPGPITSTDTTHLLVKVNNRNVAIKRKREISNDVAQDDPDLGSEPPSAKRKQQIGPSPYKSDISSLSSSVYPSPLNTFDDEIDTRSSCDYLSVGTDFEVNADCIPDSPNSLHPDDDAVEEDDEEISATTSPSSTYSLDSSKEFHHVYGNRVADRMGERTPGEEIENTNISKKPPTNDSTKMDKVFEEYTGTPYNCMTPAAEPEELRQCPLPALSWANAYDVWQLMCKKDQQAACLRSGSMLKRHPSLQPRMRAILLDWLIEVCEVYKLHRETYYLAVDYLDRYLSAQENIQKTHLQLIGITCLFVAAKVEEIYPPKIGEFAYVTDGACQESDILQHEVLLLQTLEWSINPVTPMGWLGVYMQLSVNNRTPASLKRSFNNHKSASSADDADISDAFIYPQFSGMEFVQTAQLLDLCSLDLSIADYGYSIIAAAAMSHTFNREIALRCSGYDWQTIEPCARWMKPYFEIVREESTYLSLMEQNDQVTNRFGLSHICPNIITDDSHIIQTHTISMGMFDRVAQLQEHILSVKSRTEASPATGLLYPEGLLTPPASSRKPVDSTDVEEDRDPKSVERKNNTTATVATTINPTKSKNSPNNVVNVSVETHALTQTSRKYT